MKPFPAALAVFSMLALVGPAHAHVGDHGAGVVAGLLHPLSGADHLLALVAVGIWAACLARSMDRRAAFAVPAAFLAFVGVGALAAFAGVPGIHLEMGVTGSLVLLGALIASRLRLPLALAAATAAVFALFHGYLHAAEMPATASAVIYSAGFLIAGGLVLTAGVVMGRGMLRLGSSADRWVGASLAAGALTHALA
jgi:urease accessory protein